jgi:hypothetical protein
LSLMAVALQNCFGKNTDCFRVFHRGASYRQRGVVRSGPGAPHHRWARPGPGPHPLVVRVPSGPSPAPVWSSSFIWAREVFELVSSNSENISCVAFLKHKNSIKQGSDTMASCQ